MEFSERYKFSDWPNKEIPKVAAGIYAIWNGAELFYCGMSGREMEKNRHKTKYGMVTRLQSHSTGRLSGDQFCVYVANRLVIPSLKQNDLTLFASGELKLDTLTKRYIHNYLEYQYVLVDSSAEAYSIEIKARNGELFGQKPKLNPIGI
ncbi:hypothetical protein Ping_2525 [Psychromonas ingrahamii 37]|uniref:GIY-YIG domain-containing protein n=1 Tax=Psychromonas ingrahamii (strain DSM 17664 / CCUG 51855 / 37) TaxID=357804 RepID=A1SXN1_PSYIN|nr:hypothetical protein [Psychromonas ingrahamii]ABM04246.1 hypothetical protein Ping_2525 [Psychromonas ingrahamii 37]